MTRWYLVFVGNVVDFISIFNIFKFEFEYFIARVSNRENEEGKSFRFGLKHASNLRS